MSERIGNTDILERPVVETTRAVARPPQWHAILVNDAVTPFEFVVYMLVEVFAKSPPEAIDIMVTAHEGGKAIIVSSTADIIQTKVDEANQFSARHDSVLTCKAEKG